MPLQEEIGESWPATSEGPQRAKGPTLLDSAETESPICLKSIESSLMGLGATAGKAAISCQARAPHSGLARHAGYPRKDRRVAPGVT